MNILNLIAILLIAFTTVFLMYAFIQTVIEKENRAAWRIALIIFLLLSFFCTILIWPEQAVKDILLPISGFLIIVFALILIFPWPTKKWAWVRGKPDRIDERNIMFSRADLVPGTERFDSYYKEFPDQKKADDGFRKLAGLLNKGSTYYNPLLFGAANATFFTVESLHSRTDGLPSNTVTSHDPKAISSFITKWAKEMGCNSIGFTTLESHHLYHTGGRKHNYGEPVINEHKFAIAFTVEMDFQRVRFAPKGPIVMESSTQYLRAGTIAVQLAAFLRNLGFPATAHIDGKYQVRCPEVARDAGLGELGRMSLLMTPNLGPRVRIGVVTTDLPLTLSTVKQDSSMMMFCRVCKKCAETCPSQAISHGDPVETGGTKQWVINQEACFKYWCRSGTDCGRCISVCPFSHPDNLLHQMVRGLIKTSPLFLYLAVKMDNWLYGKNPPEKELPEWME